MKKTLWLLCLFWVFGYAYADSDSHLVLQQRLNKIAGFSGAFEQVVTAPNGERIQEGKGQLWLKRPYFFYWKMEEPDEVSIISDGKTVWMYTVLLEQVTAMNLKDLADNRLLLLMTSNNSKAWQYYQITRKGDQFFLKPKNNQGQRFEITVANNGILASFAVIEEDGQRSFYQFSHQKQVKLDNALFTFTLPEGVTLDDQR